MIDRLFILTHVSNVMDNNDVHILYDHNLNFKYQHKHLSLELCGVTCNLMMMPCSRTQQGAMSGDQAPLISLSEFDALPPGDITSL